MKITRLETFITNAGIRNYVFVRLTTDTGLTGLGEATLEWQEMTVRTLLHEWVEDRVLGCDPFDIERTVGDMIRDQYQGGATIMTAISAVETALWDLVGRACGQPVYRLLGGRCHERLPAYANGWYGGARTPAEVADRAREAVSRGYRALKLDPFGVAWKDMDRAEMQQAEDLVSAVHAAVGGQADLMIEAHGRLSVGCAIEMGRRLERFAPRWYEEPVTPNSLELLKQVKEAVAIPITAGERLYTLQDFHRLVTLGAVDTINMDPAHCGGLLLTKKIAAIAEAQDIRCSPHCPLGPVALAAAVHVGWATPNVSILEDFAAYDVPWRRDLVTGWNPALGGEFALPDRPGLGLELNPAAFEAHPYVRNPFPSLWDREWLTGFTQDSKEPSGC